MNKILLYRLSDDLIGYRVVVSHTGNYCKCNIKRHYYNNDIDDVDIREVGGVQDDNVNDSQDNDIVGIRLAGGMQDNNYGNNGIISDNDEDNDNDNVYTRVFVTSSDPKVLCECMIMNDNDDNQNLLQE